VSVCESQISFDFLLLKEPSYNEKQNVMYSTCRVKHDHSVRALDCGDEVADWFQRYLGKEDFRLNYHHINETQRTFEPYMYDCPQFEQSDMVRNKNVTESALLTFTALK
jgi:hypothetical protein